MFLNVSNTRVSICWRCLFQNGHQFENILPSNNYVATVTAETKIKFSVLSAKISVAIFFPDNYNLKGNPFFKQSS